MTNPYSGADSRIPADRSDTTVTAADVLGAVLASLTARSTPRDRRVRAAIDAARSALLAGRDPSEAVRDTYSR